jgi:tetratricopeptide (TPR) repeat protein
VMIFRSGNCRLLSLALAASSVVSLAQAHSSDIETLSRNGQAALVAGRYAEAEESFRKLATLSPATAEVHATLGVIYFQEGKFEEAVVELRRALKLKPGLPKADGLLAMALSELGHYEEALPVLEKTFRQTTDAPVKRMSGLQLERAYTALQKDRQAVEVALELDRLFGDDPEVLYHNERIYGNYAYLTVQKLMRQAPDSIWKHQATAEALESQGNYTGAIAEYRAVLGLDPGRPGIHYRLGRALMGRWRATQQQADLEDAKKEFMTELDADPSNANAAYEIGEMYRKSGDLAEAQKFFELATHSYPDFPEAQVGLGGVLSSASKWAEALPHLEKAVSLRPDDEVAWYRLSQVQRALGNVVEQKKALATFQRLHSRSLEEQNVVPHEVTQQELDPAAATQ